VRAHAGALDRRSCLGEEAASLSLTEQGFECRAQVGSTVTAQETFGVVESVKAASDVYSPISGEVVAINEDLVENPGKVNESPYEEGWFIKVKPSAPAEMDSLLDAAAYTAHCSD